VVRGSPEIGGYSGWTSTDPVPILGTGRLAGQIPPYSATGEIIVWFFVFVDEPPSAETSLMMLRTTGTATTWDVRLRAHGGLTLKVYSSEDVTLLERGMDANTTSRGFFYLSLILRQHDSD